MILLWRSTKQPIKSIRKIKQSDSTDWIATNDIVKREEKQNFVDTDNALKLYNKVPNQELDLRKPNLSDCYKPSVQQKQGEMIYVGETILALGLAISPFL